MRMNKRKPATVKQIAATVSALGLWRGSFSIFSGRGPLFVEEVIPSVAPPEKKIESAPAADQTKAEIDALKTKYADLEAKYEKINFAKMRIEAKAEKKAELKEEAPQDQTLTARVKAAEDREKAVRRREQFNAIQSAMLDNGIHKDQAPRFAKMLLGEEEANIESDESDPLLPRILYKESDEKKTSISDWMKAYLASDKGAWMKPVKATAKSPGLEKSSDREINVSGWIPKTKTEALADPTKFGAWIKIQGNREIMDALPQK